MSKQEYVLVTGGAGYIGSHTCVELLNANYEVVVVDNLCNSKQESLKRVEKLTNKSIKFYEIDLRDFDKLKAVFEENNITSVIHFAGLKAVGESVRKPLEYHECNIGSTFTLLKCMKLFNVKSFVFSSSATVYGVPSSVPIFESFPRGATSPYGSTKIGIENLLTDFAGSDPSFGVALLRYFNPVGSHSSHTIGEDPSGIPNNLMPFITQVSVGKLEKLNIFGKDYPTPDGTCVRDYIHVVDLAKGHVATLKKLKTNRGVLIYNLGTGKGSSVLEVVNTFIKVTNAKVPYVFTERRVGDVPECYANVDLAAKELGWKAELGLEAMCLDHYLWQSQNPQGYGDAK